MNLRPYQTDIITQARTAMTSGHKSVLVQLPTGCIAGDATIRLNRNGKGYCRKLKDEFRLQHKYDKTKQTNIRGLRTDKNSVGLVHLRGGVKYSGELFCINIKTTNRDLTLTPDHLVFTKHGWQRADNCLGLEIGVDTPKPIKTANTYIRRRDSYVSYLHYHPLACVVNPKSRHERPYKKIEKHRAVYEAKVNNMSLEYYIYVLRNEPDMIRNMWFLDTSIYDIHHINGDHYDNRPDNLTHLTRREHQLLHKDEHIKKLGQGTIQWERVISISEVGIVDTYDACDSETSSFTANDIIVHNSGKTVIAAYMIKTAAEKNIPSVFICHRRELIVQSTLAFDSIGIRHGIIANGFIEDHQPLIQIASVGTYVNRLDKYRKPKFIFFDESHHCAAASWAKIVNHFPTAYKVGLTATPCRLDGRGLDDYFSTMVNGPSVRELIDQGYLSDYKLYAPAVPDLKSVHSRMGDYIKSELLAVMDKPTITGSAIREYQRRASGKRAVVFAVSIEHSKHIVAEFRAKGISAEHVDGETQQSDRDQAIDRFRRGETLVLSNVELFGEGFDLPAIECAILLRPTQSLGLYLQQVGRALRPSSGKTHAIILDHANNAAIHGLPDADREWSLSGIERRSTKKDTTQAIKICASCYAAQLPGSTVCRYCGYAFVSKPRSIDQVEGDLIEIDTDKLRVARRVEQGSAKTREDLLALAMKRGYKNPHAWVHFIMQSRQRKKLGRG